MIGSSAQFRRSALARARWRPFLCAGGFPFLGIRLAVGTFVLALVTLGLFERGPLSPLPSAS